MRGGLIQQSSLLLERESRLTSDDRLVDYGTRIYVVDQDESGEVVLPGRPPVVSLERHEYGGIWDTRTNSWHSESENPVVVYCGRDQLPLILHGREMPPRLLVYGAMGSGKTSVLARWCGQRVHEYAGLFVEGGITAPTYRRLDLVRQALMEAFPPSWYTYRARDLLFTFHCGVRIRLVATTQQSAAAGSPIQGFDWAFHGGDELQDQLGVESDIEARGRRALGGHYKRLNTATAKDSTEWRNFRDSLEPSLWGVYRLAGDTNPFVARRYWLDLKHTMSERDYQRKVLAMDVGPERMVYTTWSRSENLRPIPQVGARDVTARVLSRYGRNLQMLIGHDPGSLLDTSVMLKAYEIPGHKDHVWFVVDEMQTRQTTSEEHARVLLSHLQNKWGLQYADADEPKVIIRCDPYGDNDTRTHKSVYATFRRYGFDLRSAAYDARGRGKGRVPKDAGIEMVCRLLRNAAGERRLYVAADDRGRPVAPRLTEALELSERDEAGRAETQKKSIKGVGGDLSDPPAALRYALWLLERERGASITVGAAIG